MVAHKKGEIIVSGGWPEVDAFAEFIVEVELCSGYVIGAELYSKVDMSKGFFGGLEVMKLIPVMIFDELISNPGIFEGDLTFYVKTFESRVNLLNLLFSVNHPIATVEVTY